MSRLFKTFIVGILLGVGVAGALAYSVPTVTLHRETSLISVRANGGISETFQINLPSDRMLVGLAGADNGLPAGVEWPGVDLLDNLQAEMFKVRDRNDVVIGVASRFASASEEAGPFIEWALHLPARGTIYMQMDLTHSEEGYRYGDLIAGTRDFESLSGSVSEQFIPDIDSGEPVIHGRIELITEFVGRFGDELLGEVD